VTITWLWDGGFNFALISYMEWEEAGRPIDYMKVIASVEPRERPDRPDPWHGVERADQLANAITRRRIRQVPRIGLCEAVRKGELGLIEPDAANVRLQARKSTVQRADLRARNIGDSARQWRPYPTSMAVS
jgi:hypothetical protein